MTGEQLRAARAMIRWEQKALAEASGVSLATVKRLEAMLGALTANAPTVAALRNCLEAAGVIFVASGEDKPGGPGVRLKAGWTSTPIGAEQA